MPQINQKLEGLLAKREFISIATAGSDGQPNSVPKFILHGKGNFIYLIDHVIGKTISNIKENPKVSVSFMDFDNLEGYRCNGTATLIDSGKVYKEIMKLWEEKVVRLSTDRVIEAVRTGKRRGHYEAEITERFMVIKIRLENIIKIGRRGEIWKESA